MRSSGLPWSPLALLLVIFTFNLCTMHVFPLVWQDEVMFTEPAANWVRDGVMFSRAWFFDRETDIWAGNAPLYTMLLVPWLKLFGVTPLAARSFGLLLGTLGVAAWTAAANRAGFLTSRRSTLLYLAVVLLGYGVSMNLRFGRYDGLGMLLFGLLALALSSRRNSAALVLLGMLIPASGLHLLIPIASASLAAIVVFGRRWITTIFLVGCGLCLGLAAMALILWQVGALEHFIYSTEHLSNVGRGDFPKDPSLYLILLAAVGNLARKMITGKQDRRLIILFVHAAITTALFVMMGKLPTYYSWLLVFPLSLAALFGDEGGSDRLSRICRQAITASLLAAVALGLPLQLAPSLVGASRDYGRISRFVAGHVGPDDVALVSPSAWYATWPIAAKTYTTEYDVERKFMAPADERAVSILVINPSEFQTVQQRYGSGWHRVAILLSPRKYKLPFDREFGSKLTWEYGLAIYRRD